MVNWEMEGHRTNTRLRSQAALELVARRWHYHLEIGLPVPFSITVMCPAGVGILTANWAMEGHLTKQLPRSRAALERDVMRYWLMATETGMECMSTLMIIQETHLGVRIVMQVNMVDMFVLMRL